MFQGALRGHFSRQDAWHEVCAMAEANSKVGRKGIEPPSLTPRLQPYHPGPEGCLGPGQELPTAPRQPAAWQPQDTCSAESGK